MKTSKQRTDVRLGQVQAWLVPVLLALFALATLHGRAHGDEVCVASPPGAGCTEGRGWFYWPGTRDRTHFSFNLKFNKKRTHIQGSFLLIRHAAGAPAGADEWRVMSNSMEGLALGAESGYSWAAINGKASYFAPGRETQGDHDFTLYVEDRSPSGAGSDRIWLQTRDQEDTVLRDLSMPEPALEHTEALEEGNVSVPPQGR